MQMHAQQQLAPAIPGYTLQCGEVFAKRVIYMHA